jgi:hypothetical protein
MVDTAKYYDNEHEIGNFLKSCPVPRQVTYSIDDTLPPLINNGAVRAQERAVPGLEAVAGRPRTPAHDGRVPEVRAPDSTDAI